MSERKQKENCNKEQEKIILLEIDKLELGDDRIVTNCENETEIDFHVSDEILNEQIEVITETIEDSSKILEKQPNKSLTIYKCGNCNKTFEKKRDLNIHSKKYHKNKTNDDQFICAICNRQFAMAQTLARHAKVHEAFSKNKQCSYCGKCFSRSDDLRRHIRIHTGTIFK